MKRIIKFILSIIIVITFFTPVLYTISHSFMDSVEVSKSKSFIPFAFNIQQYIKLVFEQPELFKMLINSVFIVALIIVGQIVLSALTAYYFAFRKNKLSNIIFIIYIFVMLLPLQITLIPNVIFFNSVENSMGLKMFDTYMPIILPGIFSTLGVFFLKQFYQNIPQNLINIAKIDGASNFQILYKVIIPYSKNAIMALALLIFVENWNMIEQPLIFLNSMSKMPASIFLNTLYKANKEVFYASSIIFMFPVLTLVINNIDKLKSLISISGGKKI
ncbi:carbohydrate ABC transporter permease [Sedimentibacter sp. zth1]|uniref:carbohydrate ABC transporter permease n=1 Tax=Sedimentibacter sp. zth1 TaxID=2816908 RepID=UPI001A919A81|nr:carbohydrate ABC transporter permease [Sedimentibacter sp. zth1]QSX04963.1 carbohydrate ABC transporter permease [Sedimentibacter sp. zth1]